MSQWNGTPFSNWMMSLVASSWVARFQLRGASKVGASNVFSNSIGAIDAIGGEGCVESRARKSRMLIGRIPDDLPFPCVVPAGFVWFKPAVIDEDLSQAQGGLSIANGAGPVSVDV